MKCSVLLTSCWLALPVLLARFTCVPFGAGQVTFRGFALSSFAGNSCLLWLETLTIVRVNQNSKI